MILSLLCLRDPDLKCHTFLMLAQVALFHKSSSSSLADVGTSKKIRTAYEKQQRCRKLLFDATPMRDSGTEAYQEDGDQPQSSLQCDAEIQVTGMSSNQHQNESYWYTMFRESTSFPCTEGHSQPNLPIGYVDDLAKETLRRSKERVIETLPSNIPGPLSSQYERPDKPTAIKSHKSRFA